MEIKDLQKLLNLARSGRVVRTDFTETQDQRGLLATLNNAAGVRWLRHGGFLDASRAIYTFYPDQIPNVSDPVTVLALHADFPEDLRQDELLVALGLSEDSRGDLQMKYPDVFVAVNAKSLKQLNQTTSIFLRGKKLNFAAEPVSAEDLNDPKPGSNKIRTVVVPSLRVDVVGARGFGVSRAYFQAGVAGGKVRVNGNTANASTSVLEGDAVMAEGLGRLLLHKVLGDTRRGNHKLEVEVRKG